MSVQCRRTFSDERGPGAFLSLGALPHRSPRKPPVFHFPHDDDDDDEPSYPSPPPPGVPFPLSTSLPSSQSSSSSSSPQISSGSSAPILLSNGKPLKSSLKSSSSSPAMLTPPQPHHTHLRSRSAPSSPAVTPKNVHFPDKDYALATVRVYNRSARPAALSNPANGNGDETETEGEDTPPIRFPFPPLSNYEIDLAKSSPVPSTSSPTPHLRLESLNISSPNSTAHPTLTGFILVHNLAFEKFVAVRFTLDDWQTVSEVVAHYADSLPSLPSHIPSHPPDSYSADATPQRARGWDRFTFAIRLEDYAHSLSTRTLWLAVRYRISSTYPVLGSSHHGPGGEFWDNNGGANYRVGFRPAVTSPTTFPQRRPRRETVSAPFPSSRTQPHPPAACKDHALGLIIPSVPNRKEIQSMSDGDRRSTPVRAGKLNLCNYVPPVVRITPSASSSSPAGSPQSSSRPLTTDPESHPSAALQVPPHEDTSPASSTVSTPSVSPTIIPRVIIGGHPATPTQLDPSEEDDGSGPGHIRDWDWSAPSKPRYQHTGGNAFTNSNSLYNAFVSQWCFAQGPGSSESLNHHTCGDVNIMT